MNKYINNNSLIFPIVLVFLEVLTFLSMDMYIPALPSIASELNVTQDVAQYTQVLWSLGAMSLQLFLGPLTELYGRKFIISLGVCIFILTCFICFLTNNIYVFILARFFQGSTVSSIIVAGYATIHEMYEGKRAIQILAIMSSVTILAPALGPFLGSLVITYSNWQNIFSILSIGAILGLIGLLFVMPNKAGSQDINRHSFSTLFKNYGAIFTNNTFIKYCLVYGCIFICFFIWIVESPFIIIKHYNKSEVYFGIVQFFVFSGFICGAQFSKKIIANRPAQKVCDMGISIVSSFIVLLVIFSYFEFSIPLIVFSMMGIMFGAASLSSVINRLAIESSSAPMAQRVAVYSLMISLSATIGSFAVTIINDMTFDNIAILMAGFFAVSLVLYISLRDKIAMSN